MAKLQRWGASLKCSFCGKAADRVAKMIAGSGVYICNECVDLCRGHHRHRQTIQHGPEDAGSNPQRRTMGARRPGISAASRRSRLPGVASTLRPRDDVTPGSIPLCGQRRRRRVRRPRPKERLWPSPSAKPWLSWSDVRTAWSSGVIPCSSSTARRWQPASGAEVKEIWRRLSGRQATLHTGHCLIDTSTGQRQSRLVSSVVHFGSPSDRELAAYAATDNRSPSPAHSASRDCRDLRQGRPRSPSNVLGLSLPDFGRCCSRLASRSTICGGAIRCRSANRLRMSPVRGRPSTSPFGRDRSSTRTTS